MVILAIALFVWSFGVVWTALATAALYFNWLDERRSRAKLNRMRQVNLSWQSSPTPPNQAT